MGQTRGVELVVARNPDPDSRLPYLVRVPVAGGLVFRARDTWPGATAVYCHPVPADEWPDRPDVVATVPLERCLRRGSAIDIVAARQRQRRSQLVFTTARGRAVVFWQSPRTVRQSKPRVRLPTARSWGTSELTIVIDTRERYPYRFGTQQVTTERRALTCGDYAVELDGQVVAAVERKSLDDLVHSAMSGTLGYALGDLATVPHAAVVVEDRYAKVFSLTHVRPAVVADRLAELAVRWPSVPVVWCETRKLAEEWTYRFLAAARLWAPDATERGPWDEQSAVATGWTTGPTRPVVGWAAAGPATTGPTTTGPTTTGPTTTGSATSGSSPGTVPPKVPATTRGAGTRGVDAGVIRSWAQAHGLSVAPRGRLPRTVIAAWWDAHLAVDDHDHHASSGPGATTGPGSDGVDVGGDGHIGATPHEERLDQ
jgi:hypothetical protein